MRKLVKTICSQIVFVTFYSAGGWYIVFVLQATHAYSMMIL